MLTQINRLTPGEGECKVFFSVSEQPAFIAFSPEERVRAIFHANENGNEVVAFEHGGRTFQIRVINNRYRIDIDSPLLSSMYILVCRDDVPQKLVEQINSLTPGGVKCETYFNRIVNGRPCFDAFQ